MNAGQAMLVAIGFVAALFALGMGCGSVIEWWRTSRATDGVKPVDAPSELTMLGYELDGVLADFREDPTAAPDSVCIETIERVRERLAALAAGVEQPDGGQHG